MTQTYNILRVRILDHGELKEVEVVIRHAKSVPTEPKDITPFAKVLDKVTILKGKA